jgi:probable rRNA maturation factor
MNPAIDIAVEAKEWAQLEDHSRLVEAAILAAVRESGISLCPNAEVSVLLCDDAFIQKLNHKWRGIDRPTNVLSFPAPYDVAASGLLGDVVIAFETAAREAAAAQIPLREHVAHLLVHGFLHLAGHDHIKTPEAEVMEMIERAALGRLKFLIPIARR